MAYYGDDTGKTHLYILYVENITLAAESAELAQQQCVVRWYVDGSDDCSDAMQLDAVGPTSSRYCSFLVVTCEPDKRERQVIMTLTPLDGSDHWGVAFLDLANFSVEDTFKIENVELQNQAGVVAIAELHTASQPRWTLGEPIAPREEAYFVLPADDGQAKHLHQYIVPDAGGGEAAGDIMEAAANTFAEDPCAAEQVVAAAKVAEELRLQQEADDQRRLEEANKRHNEEEEERRRQDQRKASEEAAPKSALSREQEPAPQTRKPEHNGECDQTNEAGRSNKATGSTPARERELELQRAWQREQDERERRRREEQDRREQQRARDQRLWEQERERLRQEAKREREREASEKERRSQERQRQHESVTSRVSNLGTFPRSTAAPAAASPLGVAIDGRGFSPRDHFAPREHIVEMTRRPQTPNMDLSRIERDHAPFVYSRERQKDVPLFDPAVKNVVLKGFAGGAGKQMVKESDGDASDVNPFENPFEETPIPRSSYKGGITTSCMHVNSSSAFAQASMSNRLEQLRARGASRGPSTCSTPLRERKALTRTSSVGASQRLTQAKIVSPIRPRVATSDMAVQTGPPGSRTAAELLVAAMADAAVGSLENIGNCNVPAPVAAIEECVLRLLVLQREMADAGAEAITSSRCGTPQLPCGNSGLVPRVLEVLDAARNVCEVNQSRLRCFCTERHLDLEKLGGGGAGYLQPQLATIDKLRSHYASLLVDSRSGSSGLSADKMRSAMQNTYATPDCDWQRPQPMYHSTAGPLTMTPAHSSAGCERNRVEPSPIGAEWSCILSASDLGRYGPLDPSGVGPQMPCLRSGGSTPPRAKFRHDTLCNTPGSSTAPGALLAQPVRTQGGAMWHATGSSVHSADRDSVSGSGCGVPPSGASSARGQTLAHAQSPPRAALNAPLPLRSALQQLRCVAEGIAPAAARRAASAHCTPRPGDDNNGVARKNEESPGPEAQKSKRLDEGDGTLARSVAPPEDKYLRILQNLQAKGAARVNLSSQLLLESAGGATNLANLSRRIAQTKRIQDTDSDTPSARGGGERTSWQSNHALSLRA